MAAGDLNLLKSWNPKLMKNRKKVWETEQELLKEEQKFKERQKELEKESEENELINGNKNRKKSGLEWMYDDKYNKEDENQDYLLGKKKLDANLIKKQTDEQTKDQKTTQNASVAKPKFDYSNDDPMSKFNKMAKMNKKKNKIFKKKNNKTVTKKTIPGKSFDY
ncbi:RNA-splicing factor [Maudiozyma exigua]|uniref:Pre-mRNA-splicing factor CWC25 n=1 Tax=Maudiozyma exigua TaxID=34358 RepID=A0A9P6WAQ2_MAUEX|nr:RNA-splicing factor [Kazachstania exigua]